MGVGKIFMKSFINAVKKTFSVQVGVELEVKESFIAKGQQDLPRSDISGVIGITSDEISGTLSIMFSRDVFVRLVSKMLMEEQEEINEENDSAAGELANIILGQAKADLNENHGKAIQCAIPSIIVGSEHFVKSTKQNDEAFIIPFQCEFGIFHVRINIDK